MNQFYTADIETVQAHLFSQAIRAARAYMAERYTTAGGALRPKGKQRKIRDGINFDAWVEAVWIANNRRKNISYWRSKLITAARDSAIEQVEG